MRASLLSWLFAGALLASTGLNIHLAMRSTEPAAPCTTCPGPVGLEVERLGLTDRQCDRLASCCRNRVTDETDLAAVVRDRCQALETLLSSSSSGADLDRADALADEICTAQARLLKSRIRTIDLVRQELTEEQLQTLIRGDAGR